MIKIDSSNLEQTASLHAKACRATSDDRVRFYIALFDALGNKTPIALLPKTSLKDHFSLLDETMKNLIQPYLKQEYRKAKKDTEKKIKHCISIQQVKSVLISLRTEIIDPKHTLNYFKEMHQFFIEVEKNIDDILKGKPKKLNDLMTVFANQDKVKKSLELVFPYETLTGKGFDITDSYGQKSKWTSYTLTSAINMNVCPYCNRNWINTIKNEIDPIDKKQTKIKITNPQLDHYFSKETFPLFRLSFYNLIPSCETCNARVKGRQVFKYKENLHPYESGYGIKARFKVIPQNYLSAIGKSNQFKIELKYEDEKGKDEKQIALNHSIFQIEKIYGFHGDVIAEVFNKRHHYNNRYMKMFSENTRHNISLQELYRLAFGNYFDEKDYSKRPFAKLIKDTVHFLGLEDPTFK